MKIHIKNGYCIASDGAEKLQDLFIQDEQIVALGNAPEHFIADMTIDAEHNWIIPGIVDLSVRLKEPGHEYKASLESELRSAVAGGVTHLVCQPDTDPVLDEPSLIKMLKHRSEMLSLAKVYPLGALTQGLRGEKISEMAELHSAGCIGFSQAYFPIKDTRILRYAMEYAATFDFILFLYPEDPFLSQSGLIHAGEISTKLGLNGIPTLNETLAIEHILRLAKENNTRIHLCRISSKDGVDLIRRAKIQGQNVSCDVGIYHLHLTDYDIGFFDTLAHLRPPLRTERDKEALCQALLDGTIDAICSDHTPVERDEKQLPFALSPVGAVGLELLLPLTLKWAKDNKIPVTQALGYITKMPANILQIPLCDFSLYSPANLCIFDPHFVWRVSEETLQTQWKNTPCLDWELTGKIKTTFVDGKPVYPS